MSADRPVRPPRFSRSTVPDARSYEDCIITIVEADGITTSLAVSSGGTWNAVGGGGGGSGDVVGPASVVADTFAQYNGTTGKLLKSITAAALKTLMSFVKGDVGLGNVDNTSDVDKPVSTAQAAADAAVVTSSLQKTGGTFTTRSNCSSKCRPARSR